MAQVATWGSRMASSSSRRRSPSRLSRGSQRARSSSTWGNQRPLAIRLRAQRSRWLHQRRSSARPGSSPESGNPASHSPAPAGSRASPSTRQGHHCTSFGIGSPACSGRPLQAASPSLAALRRPRAPWLRLGRVSSASAGRKASDQRPWSSSQAPRSSTLRDRGWSGTVRSGATGAATLQVSAQSSSRPPAPSGGNSQVACRRLMAAGRATGVGRPSAAGRCRSGEARAATSRASARGLRPASRGPEADSGGPGSPGPAGPGG